MSTLRAFHDATQEILRGHPMGTLRISDNPQLYNKAENNGMLPVAGAVHLALSPLPRSERFALLTQLFHRPIASVKELYVYEAVAIVRANQAGTLPTIISEVQCLTQPLS